MKRKLVSLTLGLCLAAGAALLPQPVAQAQDSAGAMSHPAGKRADFRGESVSPDVQHTADWAVHSADHQRLPFIIVDKVNAKVFAFDNTGRLIRSTAVLLGMGIGDTFPPGVVDMDMYETQPWQRITPAGRFRAKEDLNQQGERVLWVDYDTGIALHKLPTKKTKQRRHERIRSPNPADHRITYGCINVPPAFYDEVIRSHFRRTGGIVYVLPEKTPLKAVFKSYDVPEGASLARMQSSASPALPAPTRKF